MITSNELQSCSGFTCCSEKDFRGPTMNWRVVGGVTPSLRQDSWGRLQRHLVAPPSLTAGEAVTEDRWMDRWMEVDFH